MKKHSNPPVSPLPLVGVLALLLLILWMAYLGALTHLISHSLGLRFASLIWLVVFPLMLPISPIVAFFLFGIWSPLCIAIALPLLSAFGFWWEGRHGQ